MSGRHISANGLALIKRFEGCKLDAYPDPASQGDPWTIGWGSTGADIKPGVKWTQAQCDDRLAADAQCVALEVDKLIGPVATTQNQFDALVSFAYNLGTGALAGSTLLRRHKAGQFGDAAKQFLLWDHAHGKVMAGLTRRRAAEAQLYGAGL